MAVILNNVDDSFRGQVANNLLYIVIVSTVLAVFLMYFIYWQYKKNKKNKNTVIKEKNDKESMSELTETTDNSSALEIKSPTKRRFSRLKDISYSRENLLEESEQRV
eukprot:NODE_218_length_14160_cov_0.274874.p7 type:complete len:107 gc:universal NODE_218_length_14160_cov_0.274874:4329-4009(-)